MGKALSSHIRGLIEGDNCYSVNYVVWHFPASACDCAYVKVTSGTVPGAVATGSVAPGLYRSRYRTDCRTVYESENCHRKNVKQISQHGNYLLVCHPLFSYLFADCPPDALPIRLSCRLLPESASARSGSGNTGRSVHYAERCGPKFSAGIAREHCQTRRIKQQRITTKAQQINASDNLQNRCYSNI